MLQSISWSTYFTTLLILLLIYYTVIAYVYFKWDLLSKIGIHKVEADGFPLSGLEKVSPKTGNDDAERYMPQPEGIKDLTLVFQSFYDEVDAFVREAARSNMIRQEVLYGLQQLSAKYTVLRTSEVKEDLLQQVCQLLNLRLSYSFDLQELKPNLFA